MAEIKPATTTTGKPAAAKTAPKRKPAPPVPDPQEEMKQRLGRRMAFAGVMIAVLLAALALFDHLSKAPQEEEAVSAPTPAPKEVAQPVKPVESLPPPPAPEPEAPKPEAPKAEEKPAAPEVTAAPASKAAPEPETRPAPQAAAKPVSRPAAPHAAPAAAGPVRVQPVPTRNGESAGATSPAAATGAPAPATVRQTPPSPPPSRTPPVPPQSPPQPQQAQATVRPLPAPPRLFGGYVVQAGVFSSTARAEELHAKLQLNGIPSSIESRVNVGPFKTKEEADAARAKLRDLGIDSVLVPPAGARH